MLPPDFHWTTYLLLNPDVAQASLTKSFAESHYRKYGSREKRKYKSYHPSMIFDWKFYIFHNPELKFLKNEEQAFRHYFLTGRKKTYLNNANRIILINYLIDRYQFKSYLEIGCEKDLCFNAVRAEHKVGVDPIEGGTHRMTSDEFFSTNTETFDIIFIDGLHWSEQVFRDITNSLKSLNQGVSLLFTTVILRKRNTICIHVPWNRKSGMEMYGKPLFPFVRIPILIW
jgi:hypothetical protein